MDVGNSFFCHDYTITFLDCPDLPVLFNRCPCLSVAPDERAFINMY